MIITKNYQSLNFRPDLYSLLSIVLLSSLFCCLLSQPALALPKSSLATTQKVVWLSQKETTKLPNAVLTAVRQDLARRTRIAANELKLKEAKEQTWPDGCLGLNKPEEICTQALIEGWRVIMAHGDHTWVYRTDATGRIIRLEE